jgi:hypothetical protein
MNTKETEKKIKILEAKIKVAEKKENAGLILEGAENGFAIFRDYRAVRNPKLKKLVRA